MLCSNLKKCVGIIIANFLRNRKIMELRWKIYIKFTNLSRSVSFLNPSQITSNSCSAALTCVFVLREEFAFLFQTFSRSDPPGKAPLTRGRYVFKKKKKKKGNSS